MRSSSAVDVWTAIADGAVAESELWAATLKPAAEREREPVFSPLADDRFALAVETIYEGYLAHYGRPRLFAPADSDVALLLGDYLYAHGLVRLAALGEVGAVGRLAALISLCAHLRAEGRDGDGAAWAATAALLDRDGVDEALAEGSTERLLALARDVATQEDVTRALAAHARRLR